ncbi:30S ribosomal protein S4e [Candidatus Micrarchaeota archaeon]|nr:30S ribosomal protein S4e [Candidatus Micrarchaeota archaeon]
MAKKGGVKHLTRISTKGTVIKKKLHKWLAKPIPGTHKVSKAITLLSLLRDILNVAASKKEAKRILKNREVLIDNRIITEENFPIGLMDVIHIPKIKKSYRILIDSHGRLVANEITAEEAKFKICRIENKRRGKKGKLEIGLHDGRNLPANKAHTVGDSVKLTLGKNEINKNIKLEPGTKCLIIDGKHVGEIAVLNEIILGTATRNAEAKLKKEGAEIITVKKYLFPIGDAL